MKPRLVSPLAVAMLVIFLCVALAPTVMASQPTPDHANSLGRGDGGEGAPIGGGVGDGRDDDGDDGVQNWSSLIGIVTSIVGNTLIALALNVQRYAHVRLQKRRIWAKERAKQALIRAQPVESSYGTMGSSNGHGDRLPVHSGEVESRPSGEDPLANSMQSDYSANSKDPTSYLKDLYWWVGQVLITIGEMGNFLAYGFAPASIVSPLGVVALIANCIFAPIIFHERFRARDFWGVIVAIFGVVTVVLSANQKETKLGPHEVWGAITTMEFKIYVIISFSLIGLLMWLSPQYGNRTILIDLGLVGLFGMRQFLTLKMGVLEFQRLTYILGAYTALSTKGVSSMLSSTFLRAFTTPVTYALVLVLLATAIMQIRYLNKALQRFSSTQVIPIQFVLFTLSVILGSAVLYRDFENSTAGQAIKFVGGCLLTFFGVFLITSGRPSADDDEEHLSDDEGVEETLRLSLQNSNQHPARAATQPNTDQQPTVSPSRSSSQSSKIGPFEALVRPFSTIMKDERQTVSRAASLISCRTSFESSPLLGNPLDGRPENTPNRPILPRQPASADSIVTVPNAPATEPVTPQNGSCRSDSGYFVDRPTTPTTTPGSGVARSLSHTHSRSHTHHNNQHASHHVMINPSPLASTVNAMIGDTLLAQTDSPLRRASSRRSRHSLRASLFVPQDELADQENERAPLFPHEDDTHDRDFGDDTAASVEGSEERSQHGFRRRARSLSNTLNELFGSIRLTRSNTSPDTNTTWREDIPGG